jgi:predicted nucleic acid-binding protein
MIFDTDVLIWLLKGHPAAAKTVGRVKVRAISVLTYMELLQGARNREEMRLIKRLIRDLDFELLPLSENIGHRASIYVEEYALKGGLRLVDALIAATAVENHEKLCTGDQKHYRQINDLELQIFRA